MHFISEINNSISSNTVIMKNIYVEHTLFAICNTLLHIYRYVLILTIVLHDILSHIFFQKNNPIASEQGFPLQLANSIETSTSN
jgi:hypothetical protein